MGIITRTCTTTPTKIPLNTKDAKLQLPRYVKYDLNEHVYQNQNTPFSEKEPNRMWRTHTCFDPCSSPADCLLGYDSDNRDECTSQNRNSGIFCVMPNDECENFVKESDECPGGDFTTCFNWSNIIISIIVGNVLQFIFEVSLFNSLEIMFTPTPLEKAQYPDRYGDLENTEDNPD